MTTEEFFARQVDLLDEVSRLGPPPPIEELINVYMSMLTSATYAMMISGHYKNSSDDDLADCIRRLFLKHLSANRDAHGSVPIAKA